MSRRPGDGRTAAAWGAGAAALLLGLAVAIPARAVGPVLWTVDTLEEFEKGRPDGVAIGGPGELTLAPALRSLNVPPLEQSSEPFLWSLAVDAKGTVYAGGGKNGAIYRVPKGTAGSVYYETGDLAIHALVLDRGDTLYAGTMPQGKILKITGEGKGEVYYQPEDRYIWALAAGAKGELYAATGERGIVYRITGPGKAETFFDSEEFHIVSLAVDPQGNVIAGSDGKGLVYRITPQGKATVLYDSALREIAALAVDGRGTIYAAAVGAEGGEAPISLPIPAPVTGAPQQAPAGLPGQPPIAVPGIAEEATPTVTVTTVSASLVPPSGPPAKSEVYRIDPDGTVVTLWSSPTESAFALALDASGRPVLGTGEPGRIRILAGVQQSILVAQLPPAQVTALAATGRQLVAATSNVGRLYLLDPAEAEAGTFLSEPRDAQAAARWGRIAWRGATPAGSKIELATRTGNSAVPDDTWSDWSSPASAPEGAPITSPPARFLQWRARLMRATGGDGPVLQAVSVSYVQSNLPPSARRLTVAPPGLVRERREAAPEVDPESLAFTGIRTDVTPQPAPPQPEKKIYVRGMRSVEWDADDPNGDLLSFDLWFRGEGESAWKPLARGLREPYFAFDSMQMPDGLYRLKLDVSDAPSNAADRARSASLVGDAFVVDNTPPSVLVTARKGAKAGSATIEVSATDGIGPIARADSSLDAGRFALIVPVDGVSDSKAETYSFSLEGLRPGEHTVIVRVTDLLGNVGAGKAVFTTE